MVGASLLFAAKPSFGQLAKVPLSPPQAGLAESVEATRSFDFDIPGQSLAVALDRYSAITGRAAIFPSKLLEGRNSTAVRGRYDASDALQLLLQGTGLVAEELREGGLDAFTLKAVAASDAAIANSISSAGQASQSNYDALLQARIWEILCSNTRTLPGTFRALLRFRIDSSGYVREARLLGSTGDTRRDAMLSGALSGLNIGVAPPAGLAQPLTLLMLPHGQIAGSPCRGEDH